MSSFEKLASEKTIEAIELLKKGDTEAIDAIIEVYTERLFRYCFSILRNDLDCEEVLQDTFIKVYKKIEFYKNGTSFTAWIYQIARNTARDKLRVNLKHKIFTNNNHIIYPDPNSKAAVQIDFPDKRKTPIQEMEQFESNQEIFKIFNLLPEIYREVLFLRHIEDYSYEKISVVLDCRIGTVKSRIANGRRLFIEKFRK